MDALRTITNSRQALVEMLLCAWAASSCRADHSTNSSTRFTLRLLPAAGFEAGSEFSSPEALMFETPRAEAPSNSDSATAVANGVLTTFPHLHGRTEIKLLVLCQRGIPIASS